MAWLQCLEENVFYLKGMKDDEENLQRRKQFWRERQGLIILPVTTVVDFIKVKTTNLFCYCIAVKNEILECAKANNAV